MRWNRWLPAGIAVLVAALAPGAGATRDDGFVERVKVLYTLSGDTPGANFGWAVSELEDVDDDGKTDLIVGAPFSATGTTFVYSGRRGNLLYRLDGAANDQRATRSRTRVTPTATGWPTSSAAPPAWAPATSTSTRAARAGSYTRSAASARATSSAPPSRARAT